MHRAQILRLAAYISIPMSPTRKKLIIDTDPGIGENPATSYQGFPALISVQGLIFTASKRADDAMAILTAMNSEEVEVIGLTTVFGNVYTHTATKNAFKILEVAGRSQVLQHTVLPVTAILPRAIQMRHALCSFQKFSTFELTSEG